MNKANLFTLFLTVIMVVVAAEFLVNDYGEAALDGAADIVSHDWEGTEQNEAAEEATGESGGEQTPLEEEVDSMAIDFSAAADFGVPEDRDKQVEAQITFGLVGLSGLENVTLQRVPFNGILFERVDMRDFKSVPVVLQNLLQNNKEQIASFYEFHGDSELLAGEIYLLMKEKAAAGLDVNINETNTYGDNSFFINYGDRPNTAFLVVKIRESVYSLTYEKGLHSFIESLLSYLNT